MKNDENCENLIWFSNIDKRIGADDENIFLTITFHFAMPLKVKELKKKKKQKVEKENLTWRSSSFINFFPLHPFFASFSFHHQVQCPLGVWRRKKFQFTRSTKCQFKKILGTIKLNKHSKWTFRIFPMGIEWNVLFVLAEKGYEYIKIKIT